MKAIYVMQPWASAVLLGATNIINVRTKIRHTGPLLIAAGQGYSTKLAGMFNIHVNKVGTSPFLLEGIRGALLGVVDVVSTDLPDENGNDLAFGPWVLSVRNPMVFPNSIPWGGSGEGLFEAEDDAIEVAMAEAVLPQVIINKAVKDSQEQFERNMAEDEPRWRETRPGGFTND